MRTIHLLTILAAALIWFGGCKNKTAKNGVNYPEEFYNAEEFYKDSLPDELLTFASIEFVSPDDSEDRINLVLKEPRKIDYEYPPLLQISDDESYWIFFTGNSPARWMDNGEFCLAANFGDSIHNVNLAIEMCETPRWLHLYKEGTDWDSYTVANYTTYEIYEGEEDKYLDSVLEELEQKSSRVDKIPQAISNLVPSNGELYFCAMGNLNRDKYDDAIIIVKGKYCECWILTGMSDSSFKINIIKNIDDMDWGSGYFDDARSFEDPLFDIVIKNGYFSVEQYGGVSGNSKSIDVTHFKYSKSDNSWLLFRHDRILNRFLSGNCCYDYHLTKHYVEKILFEALDTICF